MIKFYKYCAKEFNLKFGYKYIQLGTLLYYREIESNNNISDDKEGIHTVIVNDFNFENATPDIKMGLPILGDNYYKNCTFRISVPNCYIFCLSLNRNENLVGNNFCANYDTYYSLKNINMFTSILEINLLKSIRLYHFADHEIKGIKNKKSFFKELKLVTFQKAISYGNVKTTNIKESKIVNEKPIPNFLDTIFCKDEQYYKDDEYRIVFAFVYRGKIMSVKKSPLKIPFNVVNGLLE